MNHRSTYAVLAVISTLAPAVLAQPVRSELPRVEERILRQDGRWLVPVKVVADEVLLPTVEGGTLASVLDDRERAVAAWHDGYLAPEAGDWTLLVTGAPGALVRLTLKRQPVVELGEDGRFERAVSSTSFTVMRRRLAPGAYRFALDVRAPGVTVDLRDARAVGEPRFRFCGALLKNGRQRQWLLVKRPFVAEIALRNRAPAARRCAGELRAVERPVEAGAVRFGQIGLGDGALHDLDLSAGDLVRVRAASAAFDVQFDLWDPDGGVTSFDDRGVGDFGASHTFLVPRDGRYRVLVFSRAGAGSGSFVMRVDRARLPALPLDLLESADASSAARSQS
ncbi:MAG: hypothetical protein NXI31_25590 [bacterium]|nr:hypothetical protein [bacterium]